MPISNRDGGLSFSPDEVRTVRAALFLAIHHRDDLVTDQAVNTFTGRHLIELTTLMAHLDERPAGEPGSVSEAHRLVLSEHLEKATLANDNELVSRPSRLEWLLQEARHAGVFVPPELERRWEELRAEPDPPAHVWVLEEFLRSDGAFTKSWTLEDLSDQDMARILGVKVVPWADLLDIGDGEVESLAAGRELTIDTRRCYYLVGRSAGPG